MFTLIKNLGLLKNLNKVLVDNQKLLNTSKVCFYLKNKHNENSFFKKLYDEELKFCKVSKLNDQIQEDKSIDILKQIVDSDYEITHVKFIPYLRNLSKELKKKDLNTLIFVLQKIKNSKFNNMSTSLHNLLFDIDLYLEDYLKKNPNFNSEQFELLFEACLLFNEIGIQKSSKFLKELTFLSTDTSCVLENKKNLLKLFFLLNLSRKSIDTQKGLVLELLVYKYFKFNELSLNELSLICISFHKTKTKFQTKLIEEIMTKTINDISLIDSPICLSGFLKGFISSDFIFTKESIKNLIDAVLDKFEKNNIIVLSKLLSIAKKNKLYDQRLIDRILKILLEEKELRTKELCRLLSNMVYFNVDLKAKELGKLNELFENYSTNFSVYRIEYLICVFSFAYYGLLRKKDIEEIFSINFIDSFKALHSDSLFYLLNMDNILKLYGDQNYRYLSLKTNTVMKHLNTAKLTKNDIYMKFNSFDPNSSKLYVSYKTLKNILGDRVNLMNILPGSSIPRIVITTEESSLKDYSFPIKINSAKNSYVICLLNSNSYCDSNRSRLNGYHKLEIDLLKLMGFNLIEIDSQIISHEFSQLETFFREKVIEKM